MELIPSVFRISDDENAAFINISFANDPLLKGAVESLRWRLRNKISAEWHPPQRWHLTLAYLHDFPDDHIFNLIKSVTPGRRFKIRASKLSTFSEAPTRPLILVVDSSPALIRMQSDIMNFVKSLGNEYSEWSEPREYKPHITLAMDMIPEDYKLPDLDQPLELDVTNWTISRDNYLEAARITIPQTPGDAVQVDMRSELVERSNGSGIEVSREQFMKLLAGEHILVGKSRRVVTLEDGPFQVKGGPGSGHFEHEGRPEKVGGSLPSGQKSGVKTPGKPPLPRTPEEAEPRRIAKPMAGEPEPKTYGEVNSVLETVQKELIGTEPSLDKSNTLSQEWIKRQLQDWFRSVEIFESYGEKEIESWQLDKLYLLKEGLRYHFEQTGNLENMGLEAKDAFDALSEFLGNYEPSSIFIEGLDSTEVWLDYKKILPDEIIDDKFLNFQIQQGLWNMLDDTPPSEAFPAFSLEENGKDWANIYEADMLLDDNLNLHPHAKNYLLETWRYRALTKGTPEHAQALNMGGYDSRFWVDNVTARLKDVQWTPPDEGEELAETAQFINDAWVAGTDFPGSILAMEAAERMFGGDARERPLAYPGKFEQGAVEQEWIENSERQQEAEKLLDNIYERTQAWLAERGYRRGDTVRLYRGLKSLEGDWNPHGDESRQLNDTQVDMWALSSWTYDVNEVWSFTTREGAIVAADIPVERLLCNAQTGFSCKREGEWVVLGGEGIRGTVYKATDPYAIMTHDLPPTTTASEAAHFLKNQAAYLLEYDNPTPTRPLYESEVFEKVERAAPSDMVVAIGGAMSVPISIIDLKRLITYERQSHMDARNRFNIDDVAGDWINAGLDKFGLSREIVDHPDVLDNEEMIKAESGWKRLRNTRRKARRESAAKMRQGLEEGPPMVRRGGPGSGHFDHAGRPGEVGGSLPSGQTAAIPVIAQPAGAAVPMKLPEVEFMPEPEKFDDIFLGDYDMEIYDYVRMDGEISPEEAFQYLLEEISHDAGYRWGGPPKSELEENIVGFIDKEIREWEEGSEKPFTLSVYLPDDHPLKKSGIDLILFNKDQVLEAKRYFEKARSERNSQVQDMLPDIPRSFESLLDRYGGVRAENEDSGTYWRKIKKDVIDDARSDLDAIGAPYYVTEREFETYGNAMNWWDDESPEYQELVEKYGEKHAQEIKWDIQNIVRERAKIWEFEMNHAIARGEITPEEAQALGVYKAEKPGATAWINLPEKLYHVTTAASVVRDGQLKSRYELEMFSGLGLGGGDDETISFTSDFEVAQAIDRALHEARKVAAGEITIPDMVKLAAEGHGAKRPYLRGLLGMVFGRDAEKFPENWQPGDPVPEELKHQYDIYLGERIGFTYDVFDKKWKRRQPEKPLEEYKRELAWDFYKYKFVHPREDAGGPLDPLFFGTDWQGLSKLDPSDFVIMEYAPREGARGYQVSALGEWRTVGGDVVELVDEHEFVTPETEAEVIGKSLTEFSVFSILRRHSRSRCMSCKRKPQVAVHWANGLGLAWFCLQHFKEWVQEDERGIVGVWYLEDGDVPKDITKNPKGTEKIRKIGENLSNREVFGRLEKLVRRGGPGSGHHGHRGRPGKVGGSLPSGAGAAAVAEKPGLERHPYDPKTYDELLKKAKELRNEGKFAMVTKDLETGEYLLITDRETAIENMGEKIRYDDQENFLAFSRHELFFQKKGDRDSVLFDSYEVSDLRAFGEEANEYGGTMVLIHNHPPQEGEFFPPSPTDIKTAAYLMGNEMRVYTGDGTYIVKISKFGNEAINELTKAFGEFDDDEIPKRFPAMVFMEQDQEQKYVKDNDLYDEVRQYQIDRLNAVTEKLPWVSYEFKPIEKD